MVDINLDVLEDSEEETQQENEEENNEPEPEPEPEPEKDPKLSILTSTKKLLGIDEDYEHFDIDLIILINSAFFTLNQLGLGPKEGFVIESKEDEWSSFLKDRKDLEAIKSYIYLKTRLTFDPPQMGYLVDAIKKQIEEIEWRLNVQVENSLIEDKEGGENQNGNND